MPPVPTIEASSTLLGRGRELTFADGTDFGSQKGLALHRLGEQGIGDVASAASGIGNSLAAVNNEKWTNDAMSQLHDYYAKWMEDKHNSTKETFASDFKTLADKSMSEWAAKAPSRAAQDAFTMRFKSFTSDRYEAATATSVQNQLGNLVRSNDDLNSTIVKNYITDRNIKNFDANGNILNNLDQRFSEIDKTFGDIAPNKARELKANMASNAAYATMNFSPATARKILDKSVGILQEHQLHTIENQIRIAEQANSSVDQSDLETLIANKKAAAERFLRPAPVTMDDVMPLIKDKKRAQELVTKTNSYLEVHRLAADEIDKLNPLNAAAQVRQVTALNGRVKDDADAAKNDMVAKLTEQQMNQNLRDMHSDPGAYLMANNPVLKGMNAQIDSLSKDNAGGKNNDALIQKFSERDALLLRAQSNPSEGDNPDSHFVQNRSQLRVASDAEAKAVVGQVNQGSPEEGVKVIRGFLAQHPQNERIAFNQLVQNKLDGITWLGFMNIKNPNVADLFGAVKNMKADLGLTSEKFNNFDSALKANSRWQAAMLAFPNDNNQSIDFTDDIRRGVLAYATTLKGLTPEKAVAQSTEKWIYSELFPADVNGQQVLFERNMDGRTWTDPEIVDLGKRLGQLPKVLDPRHIKLTDENGSLHFPQLEEADNPITKMEALRSMVAANGFFQPAGNGFATLYSRSATGTPFEVRDQNNQAFAVKLSKVPTTQYEIQHSVEPGADLLVPVPLIPPNKPLTETKRVVKTEPAAPNTPEYRAYRGYTQQTVSDVISTNWPVEPVYLERMKR